MNYLFILLISISCFSFFGQSAPTPLEEILPEEKLTLIECFPSNDIPTIQTFNKSNDPAVKDNLHYRVYLPKGYNTDLKKQYACLFIQSSGGRPKLGAMQERLTQDGWIVILLVEASNRYAHNVNSFVTVYDDAVARLRIAKGAKFLTGDSGAARNCSLFALLRPGIRGIFMQVGGFIWGMSDENRIRYDAFPTHIYVAAAFGNRDFNKIEMKQYYRDLDDLTRLNIECFKGGHMLCPTEAFLANMNWMEEMVFLQKPREIKDVPDIPCLKKLPPEPLSRHAYKWYFDVLLERAKREKNHFLKHELLMKMKTVARNGKLSSSSDKKTLAVVARLITKLRSKSPIVKKETKAKKMFNKIMLKTTEISTYARENYPKIKTDKKKATSPTIFTIDEELTELLMDFKKEADLFISKNQNSVFVKPLEFKLKSLSFLYDCDALYTK